MLWGLIKVDKFFSFGGKQKSKSLFWTVISWWIIIPPHSNLRWHIHFIDLIFHFRHSEVSWIKLYVVWIICLKWQIYWGYRLLATNFWENSLWHLPYYAIHIPIIVILWNYKKFLIYFHFWRFRMNFPYKKKKNSRIEFSAAFRLIFPI